MPEHALQFTRDRSTFTLTARQALNRPRAEVFPFFAQACNLSQITPPWLHFNILTPGEIHMAVGTLIDYRLKLHGLPVRWRTRIAEWNPPCRFTDEQIKGPYLLWRHEHDFEVQNEQCICHDRITYRILCGRLANTLLVQRDLHRIFTYRAEQIARQFD